MLRSVDLFNPHSAYYFGLLPQSERHPFSRTQLMNDTFPGTASIAGVQDTPHPWKGHKITFPGTLSMVGANSHRMELGSWLLKG